MFELLEELAAGGGVCVVEVDVLVPGGDEEAGGCLRGEGYGGDYVGGVLGELELGAHFGGLGLELDAPGGLGNGGCGGELRMPEVRVGS